MSQLPTRQVEDPITRLAQGVLDRERNAQIARQQVSALDDVVTFDPQGRATFQPNEAGFFGTLGAKFQRTASELAPLGTSRLVLESIPELIAETTLGEDITAPGPYINDGSAVVLDGVTRSSKDVRLSEFWGSIPDSERALLELRGYDLNRLQELQIGTAEQFYEYMPALVENIRGREIEENYKEEHGLLSKAVSTSAFVGNLLDPATIVSAIVLPVVGGAGTATAKESVKQTLKSSVKSRISSSARYVAEGPAGALLRRSIETGGQRGLVTRSLLVGGGSIVGGTYVTTADIGAQVYAMNLGLQDPELEANLPALAIGTGLGAILGEFAYRMSGRAIAKNGSRMFVGNPESLDSLAAMRHITNEIDSSARLGKPADLKPDWDDVTASDFAEDMIDSLYNPTTIQDVADYLFVGNNLTNTDMREVGDFLTKFPTSNELQDFLTAPTGSRPTTTRYDELTKEVERSAEEIQVKISEGASNASIRKSQTRMNSQAAKRDDLIKENFPVQPDATMGVVLKEQLTDIPIRAMDTASERQSSITNALKHVLTERSEVLDSRSLIGHLHDKSRFVGGKWLNPKQQTKADIANKDQTTSLIARLEGLIVGNGLRNSEQLKNASGAQVRSATQSYRELESRLVTAHDNQLNKLLKEGWSQEDIWLRIHQTRQFDVDLPKELQAYYDTYFGIVEEIGRRGLAAGTIDNINARFFPTHINRNKLGDVEKRSFTESFKTSYTRAFDVEDLESPVNRNTLEREGYLRRDGRSHVINKNPDTGQPFFDKMPQKVGDLEDEVLENYIRSLPSSIDQDAHRAYARRFGSANRDVVDPDNPEIVAKRRISPDSRVSRVLDQEIYLSPEVVASEALSKDLFSNIRTYLRTAGYNTVRDEAVGELLGQPARFHDVVQSLRNLSSSNIPAENALRRLLTADSKASGRFTLEEDGAVAAAVAHGLMSTGVNATIFPTILAVELSSNLLRTVMKPQSINDFVSRHIAAIKTVKNKEQLRNYGILHDREIQSSRFLGMFDEFLPQSAADNILVKATKGMSHAARILFFERAATSYGKSLAYGETFSKLHFSRKKFDKMLELPKILPDTTSSEFRGLARGVGLDVGDLEMLRQYGLADAKMIKTAQSMLEIDKNSLLTPDNFLNTIDKLSAAQRKDADELFNRMSRFARDDADRFIPSPDVTDTGTSTNPILNLATSFLSFANSFYNNTLTRVGQGPYWKQAGYFSTLLAGEIAGGIARDILYNGESPETIQEKWEDDPVKQLSLAIVRLPLQSPMSLLSNTAYSLAARGSPGGGIEGITGGATPAMMGRFVNGIFSASKSVIEGEEVTDSTQRTLNRFVPGQNAWMIRLLDEYSTEFQEDDDK
tara:strand:+ start:2480 stop:6562 length:4083 start_codon:yes stop_codon:yes gene_type:complete